MRFNGTFTKISSRIDRMISILYDTKVKLWNIEANVIRFVVLKFPVLETHKRANYSARIPRKNIYP